MMLTVMLLEVRKGEANVQRCVAAVRCHGKLVAGTITRTWRAEFAILGRRRISCNFR